MINIPKGTKDMLPQDAYKWHYVESVARKTAAKFGFKEIRTPMFEHTELFLRGVGETTDIVTKEMYTFDDKGGRSMTLRPEGTAGVARCFVENGLFQGVMPMKAYYIASVFRYEKPQNGRLREHHQFGVECYGSDSPYADAEVIALASSFLREVGLNSLELNINSIGCPKCRAEYNAALKAYIGENLHNMCAQCRDRFDKNPLRILDCKEEKCKAICALAPKITDYLCEDCKAHFEKVQELLALQGIPYKVNSGIVRGLDYYTRTVFEFVSTDIGAQGTVCGGGRYNNLVEEVGGKPTPAVGFGLGLERLLLVLENLNKLSAPKECTDLYILPVGDSAKYFALGLASRLRAEGISVETDIMDRGVKAQMKYADKSGARFVSVIGDDEINSHTVRVKDMRDGKEYECDFDNVADIVR
ncbi:MAG: histidine--tRNA ligase [Bacteroides sp.]|nr:histidine--tRNA ligase [Bacillota bacterium]MCM1393424.1 histidine--tRNA ligase [[Eubacterium] siraeum]MCM1455175.1 histidine--tRNA ligase [Bacteroides sp.]